MDCTIIGKRPSSIFSNVRLRFCVFDVIMDFEVASLNNAASAGVKSTIVRFARLRRIGAPPSVLLSVASSASSSSSGIISSVPTIVGCSPSSKISTNSISTS